MRGFLRGRQAMDEGGRLRDEFAAFVEKPDLSRIRPLFGAIKFGLSETTSFAAILALTLT
jgi:hypothetical protein